MWSTSAGLDRFLPWYPQVLVLLSFIGVRSNDLLFVNAMNIAVLMALHPTYADCRSCSSFLA
ncbi:hypothetical protein BJX66DRAFT_219933 [Aspergillus keveii]|uniref:Uncharacterized protein n=1 Tax=Aspergillus keveii TaxID=714993 RepID=A0ABR4G456_9EURO